MSDHPDRKMKEFVANGCECGAKRGHWSVQGPTFCKWWCHECNRETPVYWEGV